MKIKYMIFTLIIIAISGAFYLHNTSTYDWNSAQENFDKYIHEQKIPNENIKSIDKVKETTVGGILYRVVYKDDPSLEYEYIYSKNYTNEPFNIVLTIYHNHNDISLEGIIPKYIPLKK